MIKKAINTSINFLLKHPSLIRLAFFTTFGHTIYRTYLLTYFANNIAKLKYESWVDLSDAILYLINKVQEFNIMGLIVTLIIVIIIRSIWIYPVGEAALLYHIKNEGRHIASSISKGMRKFFVMLEFNGLGFAFGLYTLITVIGRLRMMEILDNIILQIVIWLRGILVFFATFLRPYTKYYIIEKDLGVFDAIKKSIYLSMNNLWLTFRAVLFELILLVRFFINAFLIVAIPLALIYIALFFGIIENAIVEKLIRIITGIIILVITYINGIFEAFFSAYRLEIFKKAEQNLIE